MEDKNLQSLWQLYKQQQNRDARDQLVQRYIHLVKYIAGRVAIALPSHVSFDDLLSAGIMGLLNALEHFDPERNVPFEYFASQRIRGEMFDELRRLDWVPRTVRKKSKDLEKSIMTLQHKLGRDPSDDELAEYVGVSSQVLNQLFEEVKSSTFVSLQDFISQEDNHSLPMEQVIKNRDAVDPEEELERKEQHEELAAYISLLEERQRLVIALYYYEGLTLKEIGQVLDISESRVSQIHTRAILSLKARVRSIKSKESSSPKR